MNPEKIFDFVELKANAERDDNYNGTFKFQTKKGIVLLNERQANKFQNKAIQAFMHNVGQAGPLKPEVKAIQAFQGSSSLPSLTKDVFNVTMAIPNFDLNWQQAYRGVQLKKGQLEWEIADVSTGMEFKVIPEGGKVEFEKISGAKVIVGIKKYATGLGVTWETIEGRKLYKFVQQMEDARAKLYTLWANIHYGLLATASLSNTIAWQLTTNDRTIDRDIATFNAGYTQIGNATKDKGYGDTANARMVVYANPSLRPRFNAALKATSADVTRAGIQGATVDFNIDVFYTYNSNIPANKAVMVLPGNKIQNSAYMRELGLEKKDMESLNELRSYWTAFGAIVGDNDQVAELSFA